MNHALLSLSKLEQYLSKAVWILKGHVDVFDFKVYIYPILFFKRKVASFDDIKETWDESLKAEKNFKPVLQKFFE